jgi:hypothetical protein
MLIFEILYLWNMIGCLSEVELSKAQSELEAMQPKGEVQGLDAEVSGRHTFTHEYIHAYIHMPCLKHCSPRVRYRG